VSPVAHARKRPAETAGTLAGAVTLTAYALGVTDLWLAVIGAWAGLTPAAVTGWQHLGGASGALRWLRTGR
jgi:hypothetical protein